MPRRSNAWQLAAGPDRKERKGKQEAEFVGVKPVLTASFCCLSLRPLRSLRTK